MFRLSFFVVSQYRFRRTSIDERTIRIGALEQSDDHASVRFYTVMIRSEVTLLTLSWENTS